METPRRSITVDLGASSGKSDSKILRRKLRIPPQKSSCQSGTIVAFSQVDYPDTCNDSSKFDDGVSTCNVNRWNSGVQLTLGCVASAYELTFG